MRRNKTIIKRTMGDSLRFVKKFSALAMVVIAVITGAVFINFHLRAENLTEDILLQQSRALFEQILLTRRWASNHGGVYVKVRPGVEANPYLTKMPNAKVNVKDAKTGDLYTLRNPGLIVRELSEIGGTTGLYTFHVASLRPINPKNSTPDAFERDALKKFEKGTKEATTIAYTKDGSVYRYMGPLYYEKACDRCHLNQGWKPGDIRGGVSVSIPMFLVNQKLTANKQYTVASAVLVIGLLLGSLWLLSTSLLRDLRTAQNKLINIAITDGLTGLANRKHGMERLEEEVSRHYRSELPLSCLMLDIDHFKLINDSYGHLVGDTVLESLALTLKAQIRKHDIACRYGGEEFLLILPETNLASATAVAEKIRSQVARSSITDRGTQVSLTVSIGVTQMRAEYFETADSVLRRADSALYKAKADGRDRVVAIDERGQNRYQPSA